MSQFICDLRKDVLKLGLRDFSDAIKHARNVFNALSQVEEEDTSQKFKLNNLIQIQNEPFNNLLPQHILLYSKVLAF